MMCQECKQTGVHFNHFDDYVCANCVDKVEARASERADYNRWHFDEMRNILEEPAK